MTAVPLIVCVAGITGLLCVNAWIVRNPPETAPIDHHAALNELDSAAAQNPGPRSVVELAQAQSRPLFMETRRPWVAPPVTEAPATPTPPDLVEPAPQSRIPPSLSLIGIQKGSAGAKALVLRNGHSEAEWLALGAKLEDWTIDEIGDGAVELSSGGDRLTVQLYAEMPRASQQ